MKPIQKKTPKKRETILSVLKEIRNMVFVLTQPQMETILKCIEATKPSESISAQSNSDQMIDRMNYEKELSAQWDKQMAQREAAQRIIEEIEARLTTIPVYSKQNFWVLNKKIGDCCFKDQIEYLKKIITELYIS